MNGEDSSERLWIAVAVLRISLGVIIMATWLDNLLKGLYTAGGLVNFFAWLFSPEGNASALDWYAALLNALIVPVGGAFGPLQLVGELLMGLGLLVGVYTRLFGVLAMIFFANLFLAYFGGHEWIWTYVLLFVVAFAVTISAAGRKWGIDAWLLRTRGRASYPVR